MSFKQKMKRQLLDMIEFVDNSQPKLLVAKYNRPDDEIKQGAALLVRQGQAAVFVNMGKIADVFGPGEYRLNTGNLPILSTLSAWPYNFRSPIKSDVYFVNTTDFIANRWGTKNPILKRDTEMGVVRIGAFGTYAFRVAEPKKFMEELFGARNLNMTYDIIQYLSSFVAEAIAQCIGEMKESVIDLAAHYRELSGTLTPYVNEKTKAYGIVITETSVESINLPEEVEKLIDEQSGIGLASQNMDNFVQYQSARAIRDAARQPSGLSGIGAGMVVGQTVADSMNSSIGTKEEANRSETPSAYEKLLQYKELFDNGVLTQEEFDNLKSKLIDEL